MAPRTRGSSPSRRPRSRSSPSRWWSRTADAEARSRRPSPGRSSGRRWANERRAPARLERFLDQTARKVSGGGLHPLEILQRVREAAESSVRDGVVANGLPWHSIRATTGGTSDRWAACRREIEQLLDGLERERRLRRIGDRLLEFEASSSAAEGTPVVSARFIDTSHPVQDTPGRCDEADHPRGGPTYSCSAMAAGSRLTHVPFVIGRGPGNDLVLPSLAVSRRHAEIARIPGGFVMRDLGSRNGLLVDGVRYGEVRLDGGVTVVVGDVALWLEAANELRHRTAAAAPRTHRNHLRFRLRRRADDAVGPPASRGRGPARGSVAARTSSRGAFPGETGLASRAREFPVAGVMSLGRDLSNGIVLADPSVSTRHAQLERLRDGWRLTDLGSTNGTTVNGRPIDGHGVMLRGGEQIAVGVVVVRFQA